MSDQIDQFCENLRIKLTGIDSNIQALKAKIDAKAKTAEQDARTYLDSIKKRIDQDRSKVQAAEKELKKWLEEYRVVTKEKIADWQNSGERVKLRSRADFAERYAKATVVIATAAVDAAEQAALEAWLARKDAESDAKAA
jgi:chromosome segregation ATPase